MRLGSHGLQLTLIDFTTEIHSIHHLIGPGLHYEAHSTEAKRCAEAFPTLSMSKFLHYVGNILIANPGRGAWLVGAACSTADLSLFQVIWGLKHALPNALAQQSSAFSRVMALAVRVAERPWLTAYLTPDRRMPFDNDGLFRHHYPKLDAA